MTGTLEPRRAWSEPPAAPDTDALLGATLNKTYRVTAVLGEGGMGRVYEAEHTRIPHKRFAIKVLHPEFARDKKLLARFKQEAQITAAISHPHVVGVYDIDTGADGNAYLVCEHLTGLELEDYFTTRGVLNTAQVARLGRQLCSALEATHAQGVIHRDLKPANIFLVGDFSGEHPPGIDARVLDFGISRFQDSEDAALTKTGTILGTPQYMSPEQANGTRGDQRTDVYGLGAILYSALTGKPPFECDTPQAALLAVMTEEPKRPRTIDPTISEHLELVVQKAMSKDPDERYQSMTEFSAALEPFDLETVALAPGQEGVPAPKRLASRATLSTDSRDITSARSRLVVTLGLTLAATVAGLGTTAFSTLDLLYGGSPLSNTELGLVTMGFLGTLLTPAVLMIRHLRRTVWSNTARVVNLLVLTRTPLIAAVVAYGLSTLSVRLLEGVISRAIAGTLTTMPLGIAWPGWSILFFVIALLAAGAASWAQRLEQQTPGVPRLAGRVIMTASVLLAAGVIFQGMRWRADFAPPLTTRDVETLDLDDPETLQGGEQTPTDDVPGVEVKAPEPAEPAPVDQLAAAMEQGVDGLLPLLEKYPRDPSVLQPLIVVFASRATGFADAVELTKRLFAEAPEKIADKEIGYILGKAADSPGSASKVALDLMSEQMGSTGADLLYELSVRKGKSQDEAIARLADPKVRARFSPALSIAAELAVAKECTDYVPLLTKAAQLGDERSVAVLSPLVATSKTGCGKWKNRPCPSQCSEQASEILKTIGTITKRAHLKHK